MVGKSDEAAALVSRMTLEEQALLLSGDGWWRTHGVARLGLPPISLSDGPHGLRKLAGGMGESVAATCFPTGPALAATWNAALVREVGAALGREAQAADVQILLGPGINIKRSPLGGRNFEYFSEDPVHAGRLAAAYIDGVQSEGVGASLKHFAANSQEKQRMVTSSDVDERTLHEIYLQGFEIAVREAEPWTVMSAYNLVNGIHASEHAELLTDILRRQWAFRGFVVSDWGAVHDRVLAVAAGTNLEMPGSGSYNRNKIMAAVNEGRLSREVLARCATELVSVVLTALAARRPNAVFDPSAHHAIARRAAAEGIVLLKNADDVLPLRPGASIALIGHFAKSPRYQGAGSSQVNPIRITNLHDELIASIGEHRVAYAQGYKGEGEADQSLLADSARKAAAADVAIVVAGLPDSYESEGFDRQSIEMPPAHVRLIEAVAAVQRRTVVVAMNGSAIEMPWRDRVQGIVEAWLGGQAGGAALADILTGRINPSGKLGETFPIDIRQTPPYPEFPSETRRARYGEGLFVGYRHYDARGLDPMFPFGFGLSYTTFAYTAIRTDTPVFDAEADGEGRVAIDACVRNTGKVAGQEVVQLYVHERLPAQPGPENELRCFDKIELAPGEEKTVRLTLGARDFAHYDVQAHAWRVNPGLFDVRVGGSSRDLPLQLTIDVRAARRVSPLTRESLVRDLVDMRSLYAEVVGAMGFGELLEAESPSSSQDLTPEQVTAALKARAATAAFVNEMPLNKVPAFSHGRLDDQRLDQILGEAARRR